jgi:hypothetical protein
MRSNFVIRSALGAVLLLGAGQITKAAAQQAAVVSDTDQLTATVESVDQKDRTVLLNVSGPDGGLSTVKRLSCGSIVILPGWSLALAALDDPERTHDRRVPGPKLTFPFGSILGC